MFWFQWNGSRQEQYFELNLVDDNIRVCKTNLPNQEMSDVFSYFYPTYIAARTEGTHDKSS